VSLVTGLAACGDDDEGPSKAEYIEKADAVCAAADPKLDEIWRKGGPEPSPKQAQAVLQELAPEERKLLAELRALEKPEGDQDEIDRIWAARERGVEELEAAARSPASAAAFVESDPGGEGEGQEGGYDEAARLASVYGMVDCEATTPGSVAG
jgi:hypothetical protein